VVYFDWGPDQFVVWLNQASASRELVGGKAASLSRLASLDAPAPAAFALTIHAYREFASLHGFPRCASDVAFGDLSRLRAGILSAPLPEPVAASLIYGYQVFAAQLGTDLALAVRSSGTAEDSSAFSFAGLHDTVLDVRTLPGLEAAVKQCWASLWSERAVSYRFENGLAADISDIAVVVQQLVRCDVSFVVFTVDPVNPGNDHVVVNATWGLGEAIVSGLVAPDHITIDADGQVRQYIVGDKHLMIIPGDRADAGTREASVPRALRSLPALTHGQAREVARIARDLAGQLGFEADLEGGIADGKVHLFQARPITTLGNMPVAIRPPSAFPMRDPDSFASASGVLAPTQIVSME